MKNRGDRTETRTVSECGLLRFWYEVCGEKDTWKEKTKEFAKVKSCALGYSNLSQRKKKIGSLLKKERRKELLFFFFDNEEPLLLSWFRSESLNYYFSNTHSYTDKNMRRKRERERERNRLLRLHLVLQCLIKCIHVNWIHPAKFVSTTSFNEYSVQHFKLSSSLFWTGCLNVFIIENICTYPVLTWLASIPFEW